MLTYAVSADQHLAPALDRIRLWIDRGWAGDVIAELHQLTEAAPDVAQVWELLTLASLSLGDDEAADRSSRMLLRLEPGPTAYVLRSQVLIDSHPKEALAQAHNARAAAPQVWVSHAQVARCHVGLGSADRAGRDLRAAQTAVAMAPAVATVHALLARILVLHGRLDEAERIARAAMQIDSRDKEAQRALADIGAERGRLTTRATLRRQARADMAGQASRLVNRLVGVEFLLVAVAGVLATTTVTADGWSPALTAVFCAAVLSAAVCLQRAARAAGRHWWYRLSSPDHVRPPTLAALTACTLTVLVAMGLACLGTSADLRADAMLIAVVALVGSTLTGLPVAGRWADLAQRTQSRPMAG